MSLSRSEISATIKYAYLYRQNKDLFADEVRKFNLNALKTYDGLITYFEEPNNGTPDELLQLIGPEHLFLKLNESKKLLKNDSQLEKCLIDVFEKMISTNDGIDIEQFYKCCHQYLQSAIESEQVEVISVYLQILHRLNHTNKTEIPIELLKTVVHAVHGPINNAKLLNESLLLLESHLRKCQKSTDRSQSAERLLDFMWHDLCSCGVSKNQCNVCYTIIAQLIEAYLNECKSNESFRQSFLTSELWRFIRAAIESKEMLKRKQAIYILQKVLDSDRKSIMAIDGDNNCTSDDVDADLEQIWKNYFSILESLLEIQCQLIISCLEQYLEGVVTHLPSFWYSIVFALVLKHHNNIVIHHGIEFILRHRISFQHDNVLMNGLYQALNNTYLHTEVNISVEHLAQYFQDSDMNHTLNIMMMIDWQPVPLWVMIKSLMVYVQVKKGAGFQIKILLEFINRSIRIVKNMPEMNSMVVNILQNVGVGNLTLEKMLSLYEVIGVREIFNEYDRPLDIYSFESFLQIDKLSIQTKINYFEHAIPDINKQNKVLVEFYENNRNTMANFPHYEYLLVNTICTEKPLRAAMWVITPRIFNIMKPQGVFTLDGLQFATSLVKFIANKFLNKNTDTNTSESIHKIWNNFYKIIHEKLYIDQPNPNKVHQIKENLTLISMKLINYPEIYPNKMAVLGILSDVMKLDIDSIDLSRFDPEDENDVSLIQGLYECFSDMSHEFKSSHQAMIISTILNRFNQFDLDIWHAYRILLAGKGEVECIFKQKHPSSIEQIDGILADALIYGNELKGEERQVYEFVSNKSSSVTYNQKIRLSAMRAIAEKRDAQQICNLKELLFAKNQEIYRVRYYTNSHHHSLKLRITQALAFLFRLQPIWDERMLKIILEEANQTNVTHINEIIIATIMDPSQMLQIIENIDGNKGLQSMFMVVYYVCRKLPADVRFAKLCIDFLIKYIFVKQIVVRTSAQIVLMKLCEKFDVIDDYKVLYDSIRAAHEIKTSRALKFSYAYKYRYEQIDASQMLHSMYFMREIPRITNMRSDEYYMHDIYDEVDPSLSIHVDESDSIHSQEGVEVELGFIDNAEDTIMNTCTGGNVQRKLVTYRETFVDREIWNSLSDEFKRRDMRAANELIVMGSLLTKASNLGGLSRSGEIFGVKAVTLDNLKQLKQNDFTSVSMASEKWLKFFEVKHYNVISYLMAMKANGYTIVGAEQTAFGVELHKTPLPRKMILVLGHEKDGIPANILNLLDFSIEILQFGVSRSLNVHVTASLFMWEYCKQHIVIDESLHE